MQQYECMSLKVSHSMLRLVSTIFFLVKQFKTCLNNSHINNHFSVIIGKSQFQFHKIIAFRLGPNFVQTQQVQHAADI